MLKSRTTADLIADALREEIADGRIPPGAPLRQEELAARFAVSRIPVREALRLLEADGIVSIFPNRGAFVVRLSADEIREIIDLRVLLEGDLIRRAVPVLTGVDLKAIEAAAETAARAADTPDWIETDRRFHDALYLPAGRPRHLALVHGLRTAVARYAAPCGQLPARRKSWLDDHARLVAACRAGDAAGAQRLLAEHIARAGEFLIGMMGQAG